MFNRLNCINQLFSTPLRINHAPIKPQLLFEQHPTAAVTCEYLYLYLRFVSGIATSFLNPAIPLLENLCQFHVCALN